MTRSAAAGVVALTLLAWACNPPDRGPRWRAAGGEPRAGGTLRIAVNGAASTLDPSIGYDEITFYATHPLFDTLVDYAPASTQLVPRLAERWEVSPDGKRLSFVLRPNVRFSDGTPIVAADFKYSLERALTTPESPFGAMLSDIAGAADVLGGKATTCAGITTPSDRELVIELAVPNAAFLYVLTMTFTTPQRADHVAKAGDELRRTPLASGPYLLGEWDEGQALVLRRNPSYFDAARARIDELVIRENVPRDTQFLMFEAGELDTAERLSAPDYVWITSQPAWQPYVHTQALMNAFGSKFNVRVPPFTDRRVRQAFNYALNKAHVVKLLNGGAVPAHGILAPGTFGRDDVLPPYPHDPARAKALLAAAGFGDGLEVTYVTTADDEAETLAASMQADLAEVGVRMRIERMSFATFASAYAKPDGPAFSFVSWVGDYPDPSNFLDARFHSRNIADENAQNVSWYANPELDALLDAARAESDTAKRAAMYHRAERIVYDDAPWLWGYHRLMTEVTQPYVIGYEPHPVWIRDYTSAWLDLGPDGERVPR